MPDEIQGFPTIKLFPAGAKDSPVLYSGSRTIEDLAAFIKENGKYKVDAYEGKNETGGEEEELSADGGGDGAQQVVGEAAAAATEKAEETTEGVKEKVKSKVSEAVEAVKTAARDSDVVQDEHDEL